METKVVQYMIWCDECNDLDQTIVGEDDTRDIDSARKGFRSRGWKIGKKHYCKKCLLGHSEESD